jgi:hypothetical protein
MPIGVFHQGYGGDFAQLWYSEYDADGGSWSQDTPIEPSGGLDLWNSPAAVVWQGGVTVFHQGWNSDVGPDGNIWYTYSPDGTQWGGDTPLPAAQQGIFGSPSPVVYNGLLYVFYQFGTPPAGDPGFPDPGTGVPPPEARVRQASVAGPPTLYYALTYSYFDGSNWYGPYQIPNAGKGVGGLVGSAVNWMGGITVFYQGVDSNSNSDGSLWYVYSPDGVNWGAGTPVQNVGISGCPSAFVYGNHLCVFHQGLSNNGQLWYTVFDGNSWTPDTPVTTLQLSGSPSAMQYGEGIAVFHQGGGNDGTLRWVYSPDGSPGNWSGDMLVQNVGLANSPSALWIPYTAPPPA